MDETPQDESLFLRRKVEAWLRWWRDYQPDRNLNISGANLSGADLSELDFTVPTSSTKFFVVNLSRANLSGANLRKADLSRADFRKADLSRANLHEASLIGADLSSAILGAASIARAKYNAQTRWPAYIDPEAGSAIKVDEDAETERSPFEPEMIYIPAGKFLMGSDPQQDDQAQNNEQPQHEVELPDYYIAKTPVTNAQYVAFVEETKHDQPEHWEKDQIPEGKADHPVVYVSWPDAVAYCRWLSEATGQNYRLPTEAEWEKAARGTEGLIYPWGNQWDAKKCNTSDSGLGDTTPVDTYPQGASPYGVLDMAGNVWEWVQSEYKDYPYRADDGRENIDSDARRVLRGGAWSFGQLGARASSRGVNRPISRGFNDGFRVCGPPSL